MERHEDDDNDSIGRDSHEQEPLLSDEQPSLVRLPRELRDLVYGHVLLAAYRAPPPHPPAAAGPGKRSGDTVYPMHLPPRSDASLMQANRQIRNELAEAVQMRCSRGRRPLAAARLDIMMRGYMCRPSWVYLPPTLRRGGDPTDVAVRLRVFSTESFRRNDGWPRQPGSGFRSLYALLTQFIHRGPSFGMFFSPSDDGPEDTCYTIGMLSVHLTFHDDYTPDTWPETARAVFGMLKALARDGVATGLLSKVRARVEYVHRGELVVFEREWSVSREQDEAKAREWAAIGFFRPTVLPNFSGR